ncbi:putative uncharacterized protein [Rhodococcus sp. AW25M09]|uniref:TetR/AcrR family transcriptional regulator n=1 Tax=Rhodococcus sp. AW25M09 TaxID=1268303 RepID=UPI0002ACDDD0|nr:TetR/AcrR family transcriptional regulator [Rhodococcus sp. AW25M09]CCQ15050.1 putative uncharacterized protein [Rhodococcus sp. AW25M09]
MIDLTIHVKGAQPASGQATSGRPDARSERWREHRIAVRETFVDAALRAVDRHGPDVSMGDIAKEAGAAKPKLYRHFTDKTDLYSAVVERVQADVWDRIMERINLIEDSVTELVGLGVTEFAHVVDEHPDLFRFLVHSHFTARPTPAAPRSGELGQEWSPRNDQRQEWSPRNDQRQEWSPRNDQRQEWSPRNDQAQEWSPRNDQRQEWSPRNDPGLDTARATARRLAAVLTDASGGQGMEPGTAEMVSYACFGAVASATDWWLDYGRASDPTGAHASRMDIDEFSQYVTAIVAGVVQSACRLSGIAIDPNLPMHLAFSRTEGPTAP